MLAHHAMLFLTALRAAYNIHKPFSVQRKYDVQSCHAYIAKGAVRAKEAIEIRVNFTRINSLVVLSCRHTPTVLECLRS